MARAMKVFTRLIQLPLSAVPTSGWRRSMWDRTTTTSPRSGTIWMSCPKAPRAMTASWPSLASSQTWYPYASASPSPVGTSLALVHQPDDPRQLAAELRGLGPPVELFPADLENLA